MRTIRINEAEAIIAPLWDSVLGEPDAYRVVFGKGTRGTAGCGFFAYGISVDDAVPNRTAVTMARSCRVPVDEYDVIRVFAALPEWAHLTLTLRIDGRDRTVIRNAAGVSTSTEYDGRIRGRLVTRISMAFTLTERRPTQFLLRWIGLANRRAQQCMESRPSPYEPTWPGMRIRRPAAATPEIGTLFSESGLPPLRRHLFKGPAKRSFDALRKQAHSYLRMNPEQHIGRLLARPDGRFCRTRDMAKAMTARPMEELAFVGLIDSDPQCSAMAARMALSAAHHEYWYESDMGLFPGSPAHHRSFTEESYCRGCGLVLDWAGNCLTDAGKSVIRNAIIMKGLPRIEADFKTMEYIRSMNQGIVFNSGRVIGLLSLLPFYPRYHSQIEEAERDLFEMVDAYVQPDGGTLEGMGYWNYTFSYAIPMFLALARWRKRPFRSYVPATLVRTGDYPLAMRSITGDGTEALPINDCHTGMRISSGITAPYSLMSRNPEWARLHAAIAGSETAAPNTFGLILAALAGGRSTTRPMARATKRVELRELPATGQVSVVRHGRRAGRVHFHLCSGPTYGGHYHEDKGSFVLEIGDETLAMDRGVTSYNHPETVLMKWAGWHNLLCPESADGSWLHQERGGVGGRLGPSQHHGDAVFLASDNLGAWAASIFRHNTRRVASPSAELYIFDDDAELCRSGSVSFRLNAAFAIHWRGGEAWVRGKRASLRIVPLNWTPADIKTGLEGIDDHLKPVNLLRLTTSRAKTHRLLTAVEVVTGKRPAWTFAADGSVVRCATRARQVECRPRTGGLMCRITRGRGRRATATCRGIRWTLK